MTDPDALYPFRLALSYLQRVEEEIASWVDVRARQKIDLSRYDNIRAVYAEHQKNAQLTVDAFRARAKEDLGPLKEQLRVTKREQRKLLEQAAAGGVSAVEANERNRAHTQAIADIEVQIAHTQMILDAQSADDIGGIIDLPIEEYEKKVTPPAPTSARTARSSSDSLPTAITTIAAAIVLGGIAAYLYLNFGRTARASFEVEVDATNPAIIRIVCRNDGNRPLAWYVPWPEGNSRIARADATSVGILLYAMERESDTPRLVPNSAGCWDFRGAPLIDSGPLNVRPGLAVKATLDLALLRELGVDAAVVRLVFTHRGGAEFDHFETVVE